MDQGRPAQSGADEDLYLCYLLPVLYDQALGADEQGRDADAQATARGALTLARTVIEHAKEGRVDARVRRLYEDLIVVAEQRDQSTRSATRAASAVRRQSEADSYRATPTSATKALGAGYAAHSFTKAIQEAFRSPKQDGTQGEQLFRIGVGVIVALGSAAYDAFNERQSTRDQETSVRDRDMSEFRRLCDEVDARQRITFINLIKEREWRDVEPPGEAQTRRIERYQTAISSQRPDDIAFVLREALSANPRNYFIHLAMEDVLSLQTNRTSSELIASAKRLQSASRLIPDSAIYNDHRLVALRSAAWLSFTALSQDFDNAGEKWQPNENSKYAVRMLEDLCQRAPKDEMAIWNLFRASAYLENRQVADAEALVPRLRENGSIFASFAPGCVDALVASIQSVKGQPQLALDSLRTAVAAGFPVSKDWWRDADLNALRRTHPKEFAQLLAVQAAWTIKFGVLNDDVLLENKSGFELTNVRVQAYGRSANKSFDVVLIGERIPRGEVMQWRNVLSIPRDPGMKAMLEFTCDQTSRQIIAEFIVPR